MRIVVTGGAGFIGSHFVRETLSGRYAHLAAADVLVLDSLTYAGNLTNLSPVSDNSRYSFLHGDICDPQVVDRALERADLIVHFAAESHVDRSIAGGSSFVRTNVMGTQVLLEAAIRHQVGRFVHVSTDEVYGSINAGSWSEAQPLSPNSPYSASKASSDLLVLAYHRTHNLDVVITRCSNNYGPYQFPEKVIPLFITNLLDDKTVPLYGDGSNIRDWIHVDDHCLGISLALQHGRSGEVYNIGGGNELSNVELTRLLVAHCGKDWSSVRQVQDRKGHDLRYSVSTEKISKELGYEPRVEFTEGLTATVAWYRDNRSWWEPLKSEEH